MLNRKKINQKISANTYYPTPLECAALSYDTYSFYQLNGKWEQHLGYPELPAGWKRHYISKVTGKFEDNYCGVFYIKWAPHPVAMVFANRGTVPTSITNLADCLKIIEERLPRNTELAQDFLGQVEEWMKLDSDWEKWEEQLMNASMTFTGHSLGGYSADWQYLPYSMMPNVQCVTFDNPGSYGAMMKWIKEADCDEERKQENIWMINEAAKKSFNYVAHMNFINTCNQHLGSVFLLKDLPFNYVFGSMVPAPLITAQIFDNFYYFNYSLDQHKMDNIFYYLKEGGVFQLDENHVVGVAEAFLDYLWVEKHHQFWNGYIQFIWDDNADIRERYENKMPTFFEEMYDTLRAVREAAARLHPMQPQVNVSKLGLFKAPDEEEFVMVSRDNPSVEYDPNKKCAIM